ncbi:MAG: dihydrofolate synthase / folylpolyglutamate synthase [Bacteroidetes bacterium]|nr:MAG: dihydrofolate synthase / folylpolyglutamate synthase [Bacteroidota bacterium]
MFHRVGAAAYKANLDNTHAICELLKHPEKKFRSIHVAGTNGKGSVSHMLAAILQSAGFKTGLYTSPHLKDFRERVRINGKMIPQKNVIAFVQKHRRAFERIQPSFFEWTVGLAFDYFAKEKVDIAIIEVGLGGRLDSTNVVMPEVSVITNISYDHQYLLGDTLEKIAAEKAGIIKAGIPVVIGETQAEVRSVFEKKARENGSELFFADQLISVKKPKVKNGFLSAEIDLPKHKTKPVTVSCDLAGLYQVKNIATAVTASLLLDEEKFPIPAKAYKTGLRQVCKLTGLQGRWQTIARNPLTIADTGHNEAGIREVLSMLKSTPHRKLHFVLGVVSDKDVRKILEMLPKNAVYYFCKANLPRAFDPFELAATARVYGLKGDVFPTVRKALKAARSAAGKGDLVFIGGSTFTVAEAI